MTEHHRVASITWLPRATTAPMRCTCGTELVYRAIPGSGQVDTFSEHRRLAGRSKSHISDIVATDTSARFMPRMSVCVRGHDGPWREHGDGRRSCTACQRQLERERRAEERERIKAAKVAV